MSKPGPKGAWKHPQMDELLDGRLDRLLVGLHKASFSSREIQTVILALTRAKGPGILVPDRTLRLWLKNALAVSRP